MRPKPGQEVPAMRERPIDVLPAWLPDSTAPAPRAESLSGADRLDGWIQNSSPRTGSVFSADRNGAPSRKPLSPRREPGTPGGFVSSDDDLLERTLAFSGSYVSDDGNVTIRRSGAGSSAYSGDRFVGNCTVCSRALLIPPSGEPLSDVRAAVQFVATHNHGDVD
jgi:hypothetical protein